MKVRIEDLEGFVVIKGFENYAVNREGILINLPTGRRSKGNRCGQGYYSYVLRHVDGTITSIRRHRLLCMIFKPPEGDPAELVVNHLNGIAGDDRLENLEWITHKGNVQHARAMGHGPTPVAVLVRETSTGKIVEYPSLKSCARATGISKDSICHRIRTDGQQVFPDLKQFKRKSSATPWLIPDDLEAALAINSTLKPVLIKNLLTGEVTEFQKLTDLAKFFGVALPTASIWVSDDEQPLIPGMYLVAAKESFIKWRDVPDPYLEIDQGDRQQRIIVVKNVTTKEVTVYHSLKECAEDRNLLKTTLCWRLKSKGTKVYADDCTYAYYSDTKV